MPPDAEPGRWSPYAFTLRSGDPAPLIEAGAAAVQDEGSQLAAIALTRAQLAGPGDNKPERWLDMCAGPGGKARLLAGLAAGAGATLVAAELHPHRAALVAAALDRAAGPPLAQAGSVAPSRADTAPGQSGNTAAIRKGDARTVRMAGAATARSVSVPHMVLVADGTRPPWPDGTFDRILLDVPCSGLGALRRRPEARWRKSPADLKDLTALQRDLLRSALAAVRPGGVVGYVTCSPVPAETSDVVTEVVASLPGTEILNAPQLLAVPGSAAADPRFAQLWPHRHHTDAIFIALLRRTP
jgi:16S rRNA (cytosine967-C5)-methyltransferase